MSKGARPVVPAIAAVLVAVMAVDAVVEALYATDVLGGGDDPGESSLLTAAGTAAWFAMLAGIVLSLLVGITLSQRDGAVRGLAFGRSLVPLAPLAAVLVTVQSYGYDPYDSPSRIRYVQSGNMHGRWFVTIGVLAIAAGAITWLRPRPGAFVTAVILGMCFVTSSLLGVGH